MEKRIGKIIVGKAGGTASGKAQTYKISLPTAWVKKMELDGHCVELTFDGIEITISPVLSVDEFQEKALSQSHELYKFSYYDGEELCSLICVDFTDKVVKAVNFTDDFVKTAFGKNNLPTWDDFMGFLEERCVPHSRDGLQHYLDAIGVDCYDPLEIIKKTGGRMAEDNQWIEVERL